ncbi:hypothetical protein [Jeotgalicoccus halotolerans]|uniref:hypothetical protein n=1 Tax=Jeotgalicoccus halotolerans TaxID=157227 RepID=UPI0011C02055
MHSVHIVLSTAVPYNNQIKAEVEDELNWEYLEGQNAFDNIYPKVKKLTIDQNTSKKRSD